MRMADMSDRDDLTALFDRLGITWEPGNPDYGHVKPSDIYVGPNGPKNDGYPGFMCVFAFDAAGTFENVGVWE